MNRKKSKTRAAIDYFSKLGYNKEQLCFISDALVQPQLHYIKGSQPGRTESRMFVDEWGHFFSLYNIMSFDLRIEEHKTYNGYTIGYYSQSDRTSNLCNNNTYKLADMSKDEFFEHIKKEFNAVKKNHQNVFFRTEDDAQKVVDWIDSLKLAYKMKEELAQ